MSCLVCAKGEELQIKLDPIRCNIKYSHCLIILPVLRSRSDHSLELCINHGREWKAWYVGYFFSPDGHLIHCYQGIIMKARQRGWPWVSHDSLVEDEQVTALYWAAHGMNADLMKMEVNSALIYLTRDPPLVQICHYYLVVFLNPDCNTVHTPSFLSSPSFGK
jgi:hypothetical protein